ncbi:MAG: DNA-3-methyladenine glycosylase family protein [Ignavibacteriales bacterium]
MYTFSIENIKNFNLKHTFECGQCFRWWKNSDESYSGIVSGNIFNVKISGNTLHVESSMHDSQKFFEEYIDNNRDYSEIKRKISVNDSNMNKAVEFGYGMRILKQDHWETLVSFIISANNNIPRIIKTIEKLSELYGAPFEINDKTYYAFPTPQDIIENQEDKLAQCGLGFRCRYIKHAAEMVLYGEIDLNTIEKLDTGLAKKELMRINGVGPKVADCTLLYSYGRYDVFPTDIWIKRIVETLYFGTEKRISEIHEFAHDRFGGYAGFAQQYLFYYARENKVGAKLIRISE